MPFRFVSLPGISTAPPSRPPPFVSSAVLCLPCRCARFPPVAAFPFRCLVLWRFALRRYAFPSPCFSMHRFAFAQFGIASPLRCHGSHRFSFAAPCLSGPCHAVASRIASFPCRRSPPQLRPVPMPGQSLPSLCMDAPRIALALLRCSSPLPCRPLRGKSLPSPFPSVRSDPTPLLCPASLCHASAPCINALPPPCGCLPFAALPLRCPAHQCRSTALLVFAIASQCLAPPSRSPAMRSDAVPSLCPPASCMPHLCHRHSRPLAAIPPLRSPFQCVAVAPASPFASSPLLRSSVRRLSVSWPG